MIVALMLGGLFLGIVMGMWFPWAIPISYAPFLSVAIMACLDSVFGGVRSYMEGKYDHTIFFSGFFDGIQLCGRFGAAFSETPDFSINLLSRNRLLADNDRFFFE